MKELLFTYSQTNRYWHSNASTTIIKISWYITPPFLSLIQNQASSFRDLITTFALEFHQSPHYFQLKVFR